MLYLLWLLPVLTGLILFIVYTKRDIFKVSGIFVVLVILYSFIHKEVVEYSMTSDTEWWGNYAVSVHYYDDWDEKVSCRHSYDCNCSTNKDGRRSCSTCYEHAFDVDYHPAEWTMRYDNGLELNITMSEYYYWCATWGNNVYKVELNRDYYENDGDDMKCDWNKFPETSKTLISEHSYENKVIASHSVFTPDKVDSIDIAQYKLFEYPECINGKQQSILGFTITPTNDRLIEYINGYYGSNKQFRLFVTCWFNQSELAAERQHSYWGNLNKNEFLVCLSLNKDSTIDWCKTYSWMDKPTLSVKVEQYFKDNKKLNFYKFAKWMPSAIEAYWSRKHFRDFKYLKVEITQSQYTWIFIICLIICIIQVFVTKKLIEDKVIC